LAKKTELIVANKIDLDPQSDTVRQIEEELGQKIYPVSAVAGTGLKELSELLWQKVKDNKSAN